MPKITDKPSTVLKRFWGFDTFRGEQPNTIETILKGRDGLLVMQTSGGKSLCYQVPTLCRQGPTIVVSPLISLMKDQVDALDRLGIPATFLNSSIEPEEVARRTAGIGNGEYQLIYVSPERLSSPDFMEMMVLAQPQMVAIDEAHCISTWGHDFRPHYQQLSGLLQTLSERLGRRVQRFAFTATATPQIRADICQQLDMEDPAMICGSFDRKNLGLTVRRSTDRAGDAVKLLKQHAGEPTLLYVSTIRAGAELVSAIENANIPVEFYHGKLDAGAKNHIQEGFLSNRIKTIVATSAFGMGVDKPDIRHVIHYQMPPTLEAYYQEAGRGGRDGKPCDAYLLYDKRDRSLHEFFIRMSYPTAETLSAVARAVHTHYKVGKPIELAHGGFPARLNLSIDQRELPGILRHLEQGGLLEKHALSEKDDVVYTLACAGDMFDHKLSLLSTTLEERRHRVLVKLGQMEAFAMDNRCRRQVILSYFGDHTLEGNCGNCDLCDSRTVQADTKVQRDLPQPVLKGSLELIDNARGRYSLQHIVDALRGQKSSGLMRRGGDQLANFGCLSSWTRPEALALIDLLEAECLVREPRQARLKTMTLTGLGQQLIESPDDHNIAVPQKCSEVMTALQRQAATPAPQADWMEQEAF